MEIDKKWGFVQISDTTVSANTLVCRIATTQFFVLVLSVYIIKPSFMTFKRSSSHVEEIDIIKVIVLSLMVVIGTFCLPLILNVRNQ